MSLKSLLLLKLKKEGTLNDVRDRILEKYYIAVREQTPSLSKRK